MLPRRAQLGSEVIITDEKEGPFSSAMRGMGKIAYWKFVCLSVRCVGHVLDGLSGSADFLMSVE